MSRKVLDMRNAIRKIVISTSVGSDWGILGYEFEDLTTGSTTCEGEDDDPIPVFQGIGIFARPVGANAERVLIPNRLSSRGPSGKVGKSSERRSSFDWLRMAG